MDAGMEGFNPAPQHFGSAGVVCHFGNGKPSCSKGGGGATAGDQGKSMLFHQGPGEFHHPLLIGNAD